MLVWGLKLAGGHTILLLNLLGFWTLRELKDDEINSFDSRKRLRILIATELVIHLVGILLSLIEIDAGSIVFHLASILYHGHKFYLARERLYGLPSTSPHSYLYLKSHRLLDDPRHQKRLILEHIIKISLVFIFLIYLTYCTTMHATSEVVRMVSRYAHRANQRERVKTFFSMDVGGLLSS